MAHVSIFTTFKNHFKPYFKKNSSIKLELVYAYLNINHLFILYLRIKFIIFENLGTGAYHNQMKVIKIVSKVKSGELPNLQLVL